eukprot:CAMPEP_0194596186 /NCGR_PEP_ID=MMETSP0292-20121207/25498_1 /TAXON_ID=39354 /ORGANISM="Heterosigma akashiwo, Strain CCMP2393" /LENGTH=121 /DNA_ID=CAMNT_0039456377 /DNA_START=26 /DNA_END=391 /DNA_ORIENTATION=+
MSRRVGLYGVGALALGGGLLGLAQALEEGAVLALEAARPAHLSAGAGVEQLSQLIGADGQELVQVDAPELELLEHSLPFGCVSHGSQLIGADGQELVQVDAPELELLEHSLPLGCVSHGFA